jgi:hypothetical protein
VHTYRSVEVEYEFELLYICLMMLAFDERMLSVARSYAR